MDDDWILRAEAICAACGGHCCNGACPPLSGERVRTILAHGDHACHIETDGYRRIRTKENGECAMFDAGKCRIHAVKPETCMAGPFTFAVTDHTLEIYLKKESICPLVAHLKADAGMYDMQYRRAVGHLTRLVRALPPDELAVISAISEPETDLVAALPLPDTEEEP